MTPRIPLRVAGAVAAGAATLGLVASSPAVGRQSPPRPHKVTICHDGRTISVAAPAAGAHLRHGDTIGPCPTPPR